MANPILKNTFSSENASVVEGATMTISGAVVKSIILISTIILSGMYTWGLLLKGFADKAMALAIGGMLVAAVAGLVVVWFRPRISGLLSLVYSVGEGFVLGAISFMYESYYHGIVVRAVLCTFTAMAMMLLLYKAGLIRCTEKFRSVLFTAGLSVLVIYLIQFVASFFGRSIPQIFTASPIGIAFSAGVCIIAALYFILDFDFIEKGEQYMLPKSYEWVGAVSLMFSLVWLYLEILRLFAKINRR